MANPCRCIPGRYADRPPDARDYFERRTGTDPYDETPTSSDDETEEAFWRGYVRPEPPCGRLCRAYYRYETDLDGQKWFVCRGEWIPIEEVQSPPPEYADDAEQARDGQ